MKSIAIGLMLLFMAGCATQPLPAGEARVVPATRIKAADLTSSVSGKTEVRFVRDPGFVGGGTYVRLWVDGREMADVDKAERLSVWLEPGLHRFTALPTPNLFNYATPREFEIKLEAGRRYDIRIGYGSDGPIFVPLTY